MYDLQANEPYPKDVTEVGIEKEVREEQSERRKKCIVSVFVMMYQEKLKLLTLESTKTDKFYGSWYKHCLQFCTI